MNNCLWIELFDAALKEIPHQKTGLYLWENEGWENALIRAWRRHGHGKIIGVPHSTIRFWALNNFDDPRCFTSDQAFPKPVPDQLAVNGLLARNAFIKAGYPVERLVDVEAMRYQYLLELGDVKPLKSENKDVTVENTKNQSAVKVLILGDFTYKQTFKMLRCIKSALEHIDEKISLTLKNHPACKINNDNFPDLTFNQTDKPLGQILHEYDIAFSSNTTSGGLDALLAGLTVVVFLDDEDLNQSPIRGIENVKFAGSPSELAALLQKNTSDIIPPEAHKFFFLDKEYKKWNKLLVEH